MPSSNEPCHKCNCADEKVEVIHPSFYMGIKKNGCVEEQPYHKYVFDQKARKFVGKFEEMYSNEDTECYDSWHQDDLNHLGKQLSLTILNQYQFNSILDIGCGKGTFTHLFKKMNNEVTGIDISETALLKAKAKYKNIDFVKCKIEDIDKIHSSWNLTILYEILSYVENWKACLQTIAERTDYIYISLYVPPNPIGYVKSINELQQEVNKHFQIVDKILLNNETLLIFGKTRHLTN